MNRLKFHILNKYGSVNNFFETTKVNVSRTNLYAVLNNTDANPQIATITEISKALELPAWDVIEMMKQEHMDLHVHS